jgi:hypothetical protein
LLGTPLSLNSNCDKTKENDLGNNGFDFDVIVIGSGFGGSVAALRAIEKGYRVGVLEAGRRWPDEEIPKSSWDVRKFAWLPEPEMYGIQRMEFLDDVLVLCGAGVGGGSHHYTAQIGTPLHPPGSLRVPTLSGFEPAGSSSSMTLPTVIVGRAGLYREGKVTGALGRDEIFIRMRICALRRSLAL